MREEDGRVRLRVDGEERLPEMSRWLAAQGVGLYHLAARRRSLEDVFLEVVRVRAVLTIAHLTLAEARRRRILAAALLLGAAFVLLFALGFHFIARDIRAHGSPAQQRFMMSFVVMAALYAANFLIVMTSVLVTVDTLAGEIGSGVIETLCTKPVPRWAVALGKWLGCWAILALYATLLCGGVLLVARLVGGYTPPNAARGLPLLLLEGTVLLTLALAGGTRLSTLANGVTVFGLYGLAFVGRLDGADRDAREQHDRALHRDRGEPPRPERVALAAGLAPHAAAHRARPGHRALLAGLGAEPRHGGVGGGLRAGHARRRPAPLPHARPLIQTWSASFGPVAGTS